MGIFKSKEERQASRSKPKPSLAHYQQLQAEALDKRAREKAAKKGLVTDGALVVTHTVTEDLNTETLIVWADRVELHGHGKPLSLLGAGKGVESMPISSVASVEARNEGVWGVVEIHGSGNSIKTRVSQGEAPRVRQIIADLVHKAQVSTDSSPAVLPTDQLRQLAELRDAGILTPEEFDAKKAEILRRM